MIKYRATCNVPHCGWQAPEAREDEEAAWIDMRDHLIMQHGSIVIETSP